MVVAEGHVQYAVPVYLWFDEFKRRTYAVFVNPEGMIPVLRVLSPPPLPHTLTQLDKSHHWIHIPS